MWVREWVKNIYCINIVIMIYSIVILTDASASIISSVTTHILMPWHCQYVKVIGHLYLVLLRTNYLLYPISVSHIIKKKTLYCNEWVTELRRYSELSDTFKMGKFLKHVSFLYNWLVFKRNAFIFIIQIE